MATIGHFEKVRALAANSRLLAVGGVRSGKGSAISLFDHVAQKALKPIELPAAVNALAFAGEQLAAGCADGAVRMFDTKGAALGEIRAHVEACTAVAAVAKGRLASVGADGALKLWALDGRKLIKEWKLSPRPLRAVAADAAGEVLAAAGDDGIVRSVTLADGAVREMPGHSGAVHALGFTPRDGRLASAGDDGTLRFWYLVGAVEFEARGGDESGHDGAILALLFPPTPTLPADRAAREEVVDRVFTAGWDGKVKVWRVEKRIKPKTLEYGDEPILALAFAPVPAEKAEEHLGFVFAAGEERKVHQVELQVDGDPSEESVLGDGFDALKEAMGGQKPARISALNKAAALPEPEALEIVLKALKSDRDSELRVLAARLLGENQHRTARPNLRKALDDGHQTVRAAALDALLILEADNPVAALKSALEAKNADVRVRGLELLPAQKASPLVPGLVAGKFTDSEVEVRLAAVDALLKIHEPDRAQPLRIAYERGPADLKVEVLIRAAWMGLLGDPVLEPVVGHCLDDEDARVRRTAFAVTVIQRKALAAALEPKDEDLARAGLEVARRVASLARPGKRQASDQEVIAARAAIPGAMGPLSEADLTPLLNAIACRAPDTALRGARGLASLGDSRALGALLQLSREADAELRRDCAQALRQLEDPRARRRLAWMLDDQEAQVRSAAFDCLTALSQEPLDLAEAALHSAHEDIRVRGLDRLVKLELGGNPPPAAAEALLSDALEDESAKVRGEAFRTLWAWHSADVLSVIDRALAGRFADLRGRAVAEMAGRSAEAWALTRLRKYIGDRDAGVAKSALDAVLKQAGATDVDAHVAALASVHSSLKIAGAKGAVAAAAEKLRSPLARLLEDDDSAVRIAAVEALDRIFPDAGPLLLALGSAFFDLRVRAAELLAQRHNDQMASSMRELLTDESLERLLHKEVLASLRRRAASALATLGSSRQVKWLSSVLLKDDDSAVREQAARGMANGARPGDESFLLDALGHADAWVRSWAADGLSRLGDARALPVLVGNLKHEHLPIRLGAILSFAALGSKGVLGLVKGLEDPSREVQDMILALVLSRDLRAFRRGEPPELLASALSAQRAEVRFAAARALELRVEPTGYLGNLVELLTPPKPEKASEMKSWPPEEQRERLVVGLCEALAGPQPEQRYAAAQVLLLLRKPVDFFREAARLIAPQSAEQGWQPDTTPRGPAETDVAAKPQRLRKLFMAEKEGARPIGPTATLPNPEEQGKLRRLAFGAYVGLLRQVGAQDDETNRVRRDAAERIVEQVRAGHVPEAAAVPGLQRALDDPNHMVRRAAWAGLKLLFEKAPDRALSMGLASGSADIARGALEELAARGESARGRIAAALDSPLPEVRRFAFELLEKLSAPGSLDALLAAMTSSHSDLRLGVVERLASSTDSRVGAALAKAMGSDHEDLRLRAAELLAARKDDVCVPVLATLLKSEAEETRERAREALVGMPTAAAVGALAARLEEAVQEPDREELCQQLVRSLGKTRRPEAIDALALQVNNLEEDVRSALVEAAMSIAGPKVEPDEKAERRRDVPLALRFLKAAVRSRHGDLRRQAAEELDYGDDPLANELLVSLFEDRDPEVARAAVAAYSKRVQQKGAPVAALESILATGKRSLMLAAAEGMAAHQMVAALRPLLLFARAGEDEERPRAVVALGALGDHRALEELEALAAGGTPEAPVETAVRAAALDALGRMARHLKDPEERQRVVDRVEREARESHDDAIRLGAAKGLGQIGGELAKVRLQAMAGEDSSDEWRVAAIEWLGKLGDPSSEKVLAEALSHWDDDVREPARKALERIFPNDRERVELLCALSSESETSEPAIQWLVEKGSPAALLAKLPEIEDDDVREQIRYGLVRRGALPVPELSKLLLHEKAEMRFEAASLIGAGLSQPSAPAEAREPLAKALVAAERVSAEKWRAAATDDREEEAKAWQRIVWACGVARATQFVPAASAILSGAAGGSPAEVRREAVRVLSLVGSIRDAAVVQTALADLDGGVRSAATEALIRLAPKLIPALAQHGGAFDPIAFGVQPGALTAQGFAGSEDSWRLMLSTLIGKKDVAALIGAAQQGDARRRAEAMRGLGEVGSPEAIEFLESQAGEGVGDEPSRKAAYRALRRAKRQGAKAQQRA